MEKETLIQNLREKVGENDFSVLSERTIDSIVATILPTFADDGKITEQTYELPIALIRSYAGQYRHDVANGISNGKTAWEKEQEAKTQEAIKKALEEAEKKRVPDTPKDDKKGEIDVDSVIESKFNSLLEKLTGKEGAIGKLSDTVNTFITGFNQREQESAIQRIKNSLKEYLLNERGAEREPVVNLAIKEMAIDSNSDVDKLKVEVERNYERLFKELYADMNGTPFAGGAGGNSDSNAAFNSYIEGQKAKAEMESKNAEVIKTHLI